MNNSSSSPFVRIENLKTWFPVKRGIFSSTVGYVKAVNNVSLTLQKGETLGLVGESGCGKTTLGRSIMGLEKIHSGNIWMNNSLINNLQSKDKRKIRKQIQMVFQDPISSLNPRRMIMDIVTEGMIAHKLIAKKDKKDVSIKLLNEVGIESDVIYRYPHEFSGGQRQRISIARAISMHPDIIICDEAVSALDVSVQAQVINLLMDLRDTHRFSYLFISHDLSVVNHISHRIVVMYLGQIVEMGQTNDIINKPYHPYTRALIASIPVIGKKGNKIILKGTPPSPMHPPEGCTFHPRCSAAKSICQKSAPKLNHVDGHDIRCHLYS